MDFLVDGMQEIDVLLASRHLRSLGLQCAYSSRPHLLGRAGNLALGRPPVKKAKEVRSLRARMARFFR